MGFTLLAELLSPPSPVCGEIVDVLWRKAEFLVNKLRNRGEAAGFDSLHRMRFLGDCQQISPVLGVTSPWITLVHGSLKPFLMVNSRWLVWV